MKFAKSKYNNNAGGSIVVPRPAQLLTVLIIGTVSTASTAGTHTSAVGSADGGYACADEGFGGVPEFCALLGARIRFAGLSLSSNVTTKNYKTTLQEFAKAADRMAVSSLCDACTFACRGPLPRTACVYVSSECAHVPSAHAGPS